MVVPIDEITSHSNVQVGVTIASVRVALELLFGFLLCFNENCNIRERGGHEDAKNRDDDSGTTQ